MVRQGLTAELRLKLQLERRGRRLVLSILRTGCTSVHQESDTHGGSGQHCGLCPRKLRLCLETTEVCLHGGNTITNANAINNHQHALCTQLPSYPELSSSDNFYLLEVISKYSESWGETQPLTAAHLISPFAFSLTGCHLTHH